MLDNKRMTPIIALFGALALLASTPAFAQTADQPAAVAAEAAPAAATEAAPAAAPGSPAPITMDTHGGKMTVMSMFLNAGAVVKVVMIGLALSSVFSWTLLITKIFEFNALVKASDNFVEAFRSAKSIDEMGKISGSEDFVGNPLADMASAACMEIILSRQAGLKIGGEHRESTVLRASSAVSAVQGSLSKRLSSGMQFLASVASSGPFIGLFGTVYGIMNSFIGIANTNTTNLAVVAPGIAEALLATGIGLFAAIPSMIFYNYFQTRISAYGIRSEGFVVEVLNAMSRQLDKGA